MLACGFRGDIRKCGENMAAAGQSRKVGDHTSAIHRKQKQ